LFDKFDDTNEVFRREAIIQRTDNAIAKRKWTKGPTMIDKILH